MNWVAVLITAIVAAATLALSAWMSARRARRIRRSVREAVTPTQKRQLRLKELRRLDAMMLFGLVGVGFALWQTGWPRWLIVVPVGYTLVAALVMELAVRRDWPAWRSWGP